jgi:hypothetical protein
MKLLFTALYQNLTGEMLAAAYVITTDASSRTASWAWTGGGDANAAIASFKPAASTNTPNHGTVF